MRFFPRIQHGLLCLSMLASCAATAPTHSVRDRTLGAPDSVVVEVPRSVGFRLGLGATPAAQAGFEFEAPLTADDVTFEDGQRSMWIDNHLSVVGAVNYMYRYDEGTYTTQSEADFTGVSFQGGVRYSFLNELLLVGVEDSALDRIYAGLGINFTTGSDEVYQPNAAIQSEYVTYSQDYTSVYAEFGFDAGMGGISLRLDSEFGVFAMFALKWWL